MKEILFFSVFGRLLNRYFYSPPLTNIFTPLIVKLAKLLHSKSYLDTFSTSAEAKPVFEGRNDLNMRQRAVVS